MSYFIFIGDMLVMLFMVVLVVWVFVKSSDKTVDESARIPLTDEQCFPENSETVEGR